MPGGHTLSKPRSRVARQLSTVARAVSGLTEVATRDSAILDAGPSPSKAARDILNGVGTEQVLTLLQCIASSCTSESRLLLEQLEETTASTASNV